MGLGSGFLLEIIMKIFVSWSGKKSKEMSVILNNWLPLIFPHAQIFISSEIEKGANFLEVILTALKESSVGIFLLTKGNTTAPWIQFEAGAFASKGLHARVCPLYVDNDIEIEDTGPLRFFQGSLINESEIFKLLSSINAVQDTPYQNEKLLRLYESNKREFFHNWDLIKNMQCAHGAARKTTKELIIDIIKNTAKISECNENIKNLISATEDINKIKIERYPSYGIGTIKANTISPKANGVPKFSTVTPDGGDFSSLDAYEIAAGRKKFEYQRL